MVTYRSVPKGGGNMAAPKITPEIGEHIMSLAPTMSNRQIAEELSKAGVSISHVSVGRFIRSQRKERAEQTKAIVQEHIRVTVPTDLEILQEIRDQLNAWRKDANLRVSERLMVIDRLNKVIDTRLKFSGAGEPDDDEFAGMSDKELESYVNGEA